MNGSWTLAAGLQLLPAIVWGAIAQHAWYFLRSRRPTSAVFHVLPFHSSTLAIGFGIHFAVSLLPPAMVHDPPPLLRVVIAIELVAFISAVALLLHLLWVVPFLDRTPRPSWLAINYGVAFVVALIAVVGMLTPRGTGGFEERLRLLQLTAWPYTFVCLVLAARQLWRISQRGGWRAEGFMEARRPDLVIVAVVAATLGLVYISVIWLGPTSDRPQAWAPIINSAVGLALAAPIAIRMLGEVAPRILIAIAATVASATIFLERGRVEKLAGVTGQPFVDALVIAAMVLALIPGQRWLRSAIDRLLLQRARRRHARLQDFLRTLSPELDVHECCRRALEEITLVMNSRGAAIILADGEGVITSGTFTLDPLTGIGASGMEAIPALDRGLGVLEMSDLPSSIRQALRQLGVAGVFPITSPSRRWGHLLMMSGLVGAVLSDEDAQLFSSFTSQLALALDGSRLLSRAVAVERSFAHAEKLAAIGELAARVAHEIRNPVTAAKSLAQQLVHEPDLPYLEELKLILSELERIERQVASLLRFSRRDQFEFAELDLGDLVRQTVFELRPPLEDRGIAVEATVSGVVMKCRADREKLRQVLVNLIENARDALESQSDPRISVAVSGANGRLTVSVSDNGPGVPDEALPRIFEPFFTLKGSGTGLGLAIAKRTVEAHGGQITAARSEEAGMSFRIDLPSLG